MPLQQLQKQVLDLMGASGKHTFDAAGDVIGNGYDVCSFSYTAPSASFGCSQFWTVADGLSDLP